MRRITVWLLTAIVALMATLYLLLNVFLWAFQEQLMFGRRTRELVATPESVGLGYEEVWLDVEGERTHGWWLPLDNARGVVLFSHGSGRNISGYLKDAVLFQELGLSVLLYDYGGYGQSTGEPSEARCYADAHAMWRHLVEDRGVPAASIVLAGSSMGSGVTCELVTRVHPAAVILESAFTSVPDALRDTFPIPLVPWLFRIHFRNIDKVDAIACPTLVIHSRDDTVTPFTHGRALYERLTSPKVFVEIQGAHYGGKFQSRDVYLKGAQTFLERLVFP